MIYNLKQMFSARAGSIDSNANLDSLSFRIGKNVL